MTVTKALFLHLRKVMRCMLYTVCFTSLNSTLDRMLVKDNALKDVRRKMSGTEETCAYALSILTTQFFAETETFCVLDYSLQHLHAESKCGQEYV